MKEPKEQQIQSEILRLLRLKKCVAVKVPAGGIRSQQGSFIRLAEKGVSDILACCRGTFCAIEVKRPGNVPTSHQEDFLDDVRRAGGIGIVAYGLDEVIEMLDSLER